MFNNGRIILATGAFVVLAGVAVTGWLRNPTHTGAASNVAAVPAYTAQPAYPTPSYTQNGSAQPAYSPDGNAQAGNTQAAYTQRENTQPVYVADSGDGYYSTTPRPIYVRIPAPPPPEPVAAEQQPVFEDQPYIETRYVNGHRVQYRRYRHGRSKKHSAEIVAGTAGVGAIIGAIAGGGPGAAIGAASGAGVGFAYDRLTHNH